MPAATIKRRHTITRKGTHHIEPGCKKEYTPTGPAQRRCPECIKKHTPYKKLKGEKKAPKTIKTTRMYHNEIRKKFKIGQPSEISIDEMTFTEIKEEIVRLRGIISEIKNFLKDYYSR